MSRVLKKLFLGDVVAKGTTRQLRKLTTEKETPLPERLDGALTFSSPNSFTLNTYNNKKNWNGKLEYSTDTNTWNVWSGTTTISSPEGKLFLRGTGNTYITFNASDCRWVLTGSDIACVGNIENLLDYQTVANGDHPTMRGQAFRYLFEDCTSLTMAPELPATTLSSSCYWAMFNGCTSLTVAPELPATVTAFGCYGYMFENCSNLVAIPKLPATVLSDQCYWKMFNGCTKIKLSTTQTGEYQTAYRIPTIGTGTSITGALNYMFTDTGGTFTGTPSINTTYYTSNTVV